MSKFGNARKEAFLKQIPTASIESNDDKITIKCKFNFGYMDFSQHAGQSFDDWDKIKLVQLLQKLHNYSKEPLLYWTTQSAGKKSGKILVVYEDFPANSEFTHPKHIPHQVYWARFRLDYILRLIGFIIPSKYNHQKHPVTGLHFDCNTFYVVFLDSNHKFYIPSK